LANEGESLRGDQLADEGETGVDLTGLGRVVLLLGGVMVLLGGAMMLLGRWAFLGRLPGDITFRRGNVSCHVPIVSSIVLSVILTTVLNLVMRLLNR